MWLQLCMRGFHVYKNVWEPTVDEVLLCEREIGNSHDTFAVAVRNSSEIVGHVPMQIPFIDLFNIYMKSW